MSDLIDRQAAIEVIDAVFPVDAMKSEYAQGIACGAALAKTYVEQLPSAQPKVKCIAEIKISKEDMEELVEEIKAAQSEIVPQFTVTDGEPQEFVPVVRCKDCRWGREVCGNIKCFVDINVPPEYHGYEWYCPNGERREE